MIASGTNGTCTWSIDDNGELYIRPTNNNSGYILLTGITDDYPWTEYIEQITSIILTGSIYSYHSSWSGPDEETGDFNQLFRKMWGTGQVGGKNAVNVVTIDGIESLKRSKKLKFLLRGMKKLTSIDFSDLDTSLVESFEDMFSECDLLSQVTFGNNFDMSAAIDKAKNDPNGYTCYYNTSIGKATNTNGIVIQNDDEFAFLTTEERAGTWNRGVAKSFNSIAKRSSNGSFDEDGNDVIITITWATDSEQDNRELKIYQKLSSTPYYPSTPIVTQNLIGDSGITPITISNIGDEAYDFKVVFYDGINTFIAFPAVQSNVRLITIDEKGRVECGDYGGNLKSIFDIFYPVGSYYETSLPDAIPSGESTPTDTDLANLGTTWFNPKYAWGGEWILETAGLVHVSGATEHAKYPVSSTYTDANNGAGQKQDGDEDAIVPTHDHPITRTTDVAVTVTKSVSNADSITGGSHGHKIKYNPNTGASGSARHVLSASGSSETSSNATSSDTHTHSVPKHSHSTSVTQPVFDVGNRGVNGTGKNMQPYINVYRWHRTA